MNRIVLASLGVLLLLSCDEPVMPPTPPTGVTPRAAAAAWMKEAALPLSSVEVGHGFDDLAPLKPVLANTQVVGLGESTHGTREFFQLKHRMFEFLVSELGFTVFALEANFTEATAIDRYVLTGEGDPARALAGLYFWTWDTEEILALIHWMRAYNADPAHTRKLRFYGVDMQYSRGPAQALLDSLAQVDPAYRSEVEPWLTRLLSTGELNGSDPEDSLVRAAGHVPRVQALRAQLEARREQYVQSQGEEAYLWMTQHALLLEQTVLLYSLRDAARANRRDVYMAENVRWVLEHEGPEAKMALWAHNAHLMPENGASYTAMGAHLRDTFGDAFYMFRLTFNQGEFRARLYPRGGPAQEVQTHLIGPAPSESIEASLAGTGLPLLALDLRSAPSEGAVASYLKEPVPTRELSAVYTPGYHYLFSLSPRLTCDGLLFVEKTTASRPNPPLAP